MSALYMDGFDHYGTGNTANAKMLEGPWAEMNNVNGPGVPVFGSATGTYSMQGGAGVARYVLPSTKTRMFLSMRFAVTSLPISNNLDLVVSFRDNTNTIIASLFCQSTGSLALIAPNGTTILAQTSGPVITASTWHFLEMDFDQAGGKFTLRIDDATASETPAISATGLSLSGAAAQLTFLSGGSGGTTIWIDDLFIRDTSGTVNNSWLGDRRISTLAVDQDTTTAGWSANRYSKIAAGILNITAADSCLRTPSATFLDIDNSDFTLETFVRFQSLPTSMNKAVIFSRWENTTDQRSYELFLGSQGLNGGSLCFQTSTDGLSGTVAQPIVYPWQPDLDTWYHVAVVRASGQLLLFVDGEQLGLPIADSSTYFAGTSRFAIGAEPFGFTVVTGTKQTGWFDETRFTNGVARYTANFTPTTVAFPRGGTDPDWSSVAFLAGYDTIIQDESSHAQTVTAVNNAVQQTVTDSPSVGVWPVVGKTAPDDNTFIEAPFVAATSILTLTVNASNTNTVTVGTTDGATPAVYTFKTVLVSAFDVLIDVDIEATLQNLYNAINAGPGSGTKYHTGTTVNNDVLASQLPTGQMMVTALIAGTTGNSIASTSTGITGGWTDTTLDGGLDIPGPSEFKTQRLVNTTTIISAIQINTRAFKTDSGIGTITSSFVGPLGGVAAGDSHPLTVNPIYYKDIFETDPDTAGPISPTTIIGGTIEINRDT